MKHLASRVEKVDYECNVCGESYPEKDMLSTHVKTGHALDLRFECEICNKCFTKNTSLQRHHRTHTGERPFTCDVCDASFTHPNRLRTHLISDHLSKVECDTVGVDDNSHSCVICNRCFSSKEELNEHGELHKKIKIVECDICHKQFCYASKMKTHRAKHTRDLRHHCNLCGETFFQKGLLSSHIKTKHTGELECEFCKKCFTKRNSLQRHRRTHTGEKPFSCEQCDASFAHTDLLKDHVVRKHLLRVGASNANTDDNSLNCVICNRRFSTKQELKKHKELHKKIKISECDVCHKQFPYASEMRKHRVIHDGKVRYECNACGESYSQKAKLSMHVKTQHTGELQFKCEYCFKSFTTSNSLQRHFRIHTGEKPFRCDFCHESFTYPRQLKGHVCNYSSEVQGNELESLCHF